MSRRRQRVAQAAAHHYGALMDPLSVFDDTFDGDLSKWTEYKSAAVATQTVSGGELDLEVNAGGGGVGGATSFWFDGTANGQLLYQTISGAFDARLRARVRNTANSGNPPATSFRIAGIAAHDPDRTNNVFNYLHIGAGSTGGAGNTIEWKTTDDADASNDTSAFDSVAWTGTDLDVDLRMVRRASNTQIFDLYWRETEPDLLSAANWTSLVTVDRTDNTTPDRDANGASANQAISLPNTIQVGLIVYSNVTTHDIRMFAEEFRVRSTAA